MMKPCWQSAIWKNYIRNFKHNIQKDYMKRT
jgi:hypothetical protein